MPFHHIIGIWTIDPEPDAAALKIFAQFPRYQTVMNTNAIHIKILGGPAAVCRNYDSIFISIIPFCIENTSTAIFEDFRRGVGCVDSPIVNCLTAVNIPSESNLQ